MKNFSRLLVLGLGVAAGALVIAWVNRRENVAEDLNQLSGSIQDRLIALEAGEELSRMSRN